MKLIRSLAAACAALFLFASLFAADGSPAGTWKWTIETPNGDSIEASARLELDGDGKLSGTYESPFGAAKISDGSFKDDTVAFAVEREFDGNKFTVKYTGKLEGDAINGTIELPGFDGGEPTKMPWRAKRAK